MKLNQVLDYVNFIIVKELSGDILTPAKFNMLLVAVNLDMFNDKVREVELYANQNQIPFTEALFGHKALREFHNTQSISLTTGTYNLTSLTGTYGYWGSLTALYGNRRVEIELLNDKEFAGRRTNLLTNPIENNPIATITANTLRVLPTNIATAEIYFMKIPAEPVYDYYSDQYQNKIYLEYDTSHLLTVGEIGSAGQVEGQTVASLTTELEWNQLHHIDFCMEILKKCSVNLNKAEVYQYAQQEKL